MEVVSDWWLEIDPKGRLEMPTQKVGELLVLKGIASDVDTAKKIMQKSLQKKEKLTTNEDFNKIFCKCIFKEALINMFESIDNLPDINSDVPLQLKLGTYQRTMMMQGLE